MADLYGVGCPACNREIAAAYKEMPLMEGYLSTDEYAARYHHLPVGTWPLPYVDGEYKPETSAIVIAEDGWLICNHQRLHPVSGELLSNPCDCGNPDAGMCVELWRGRVELGEGHLCER